MIFYNFGDGN